MEKKLENVKTGMKPLCLFTSNPAVFLSLDSRERELRKKSRREEKLGKDKNGHTKKNRNLNC